MNPTFVFSILFITSIFVAIIVYINGLPNDLDFKGQGEKIKIPERNVLIFGFLQTPRVSVASFASGQVVSSSRREELDSSCEVSRLAFRSKEE